MKARLLGTIPALALAFSSGFGCSTKSSTGGTATGGTGGTATGGTGGTATGGTGGTATGGTGGTGPVDQCTSASDKAAVVANYPDEGGASRSVPDIAKACGKSCLTKPSTCTLNCIQTQTNNAITKACSTCYVNTVNCAIAHCLVPCLGTKPACDPCLCGNNKDKFNCIDQTAKCTGLPATTCSAPDGGTDAG